MRKLITILCIVIPSSFLMAQHKQDSSTTDIISDSAIRSDSSKVSVLKEVTVTGKKPFIQLLPDKTVVNVDASITNSGATLMEVLEKSPGISIDRNGNISIKGRQGVLVMIDGKPSQVSGNELNNLLSGMTASQVDQIEIMDNPSAKYDAAGNAGIINIKTKKNRQRGFNGNINFVNGQGRFNRSIHTVTINHYSGKVNLFATIGVNLNRNFSKMYALRKYYLEDNTTLIAQLEQPSYFTGRAPSQTFKTGFDYFINKKTTAGAVLSTTLFSRRTKGFNSATWMDDAGNYDSLITTHSNNKDRMNSYTANFNARHVFSTNSELTADLDFIRYRIQVDQFFNNTSTSGPGYDENLTGFSPSSINIMTGKTDYTKLFSDGIRIESGWKSSHINTNNGAEYFLTTGSVTVPNYGMTNHFLYEENIHAAYTNLEKKWERLSLQAGIRYENTAYHARQLGNAVRKDSSFSRNYDDFFPNTNIGFKIDSIHSLSFSAGRRIDRPAFQRLNPFIFVINKYTYQAGNPYFRPQYTWNTELSHTYREIIVTSLNYSFTKDYFSQVFLIDTTGVVTYTEGNLDHMKNIGLSVSAQLSLFPWWSLSFQGTVNHKKIKGFIWNDRTASLTQANFNMNNQFLFGKGWSGEVSGFYMLKEQELQEITDPTGQLTAGISKQILKNKGTLKFMVRDIFYTQAMKGFTNFQQSTEYFKIQRDSRSASIAFSYRFGRQAKSAPVRNTGGAEDEMRRANTTG